jgi:hypothetical protein
MAGLLGNPSATILLTGYVPTTSPAHQLRQLRAGPGNSCPIRTVRVGEEEFDVTAVRATVEDLSEYYSGHTDESGLTEFALRRDTEKDTPPVAIVLNHGDRVAREALKMRLEQVATEGGEAGRYRRLKQVYLPNWEDGWFDLATGDWETPSPPPTDVEDRLRQVECALAEVLANQESIMTRLEELTRGR